MLYYIILSFDFFLIDIFAHLFVAIQDWTNASTILTSFSVHIEIQCCPAKQPKLIG